MKRGVVLVLVLCCCMLLVGLAAHAANPKAPSLVRVLNATGKAVHDLADIDVEIASVGSNYVDVVCPDGNHKVLINKGNKVQVLIPDLDEYVRQVLAASKEGQEYYTFDSMTSQLHNWAEEYQHIVRLESIGKSHEGRDIWALKVSDHPELDEAEPAALIMGAHHAREWISTEVPMATIKALLEGYGRDEYLTRLVNERETWFVPMVNPDGVHFSQNKTRYWRKNRRNNGGNSYGVDLNRNYSWHWSESGSSTNPNSDTYHGPAPFSEPEAQAIALFAKRECFQVSASFHSYSQLILYPWSWASNIPCEDQPTLSKLAKEMAEFNSYTPKVSAGLYPAAGDSDDFLYGELKVLAYTFELATTFIPHPSQIEEINRRNVPAMLHMIDKAGPYGLMTPSGAVSLLAHLDITDSKAAIEYGRQLLDSVGPEASLAINVADRLAKVEAHLSDLIVREVNGGTTSLIDQFQGPAFDKVRDNVRQRGIFLTVHNEACH